MSTTDEKIDMDEPNYGNTSSSKDSIRGNHNGHIFEKFLDKSILQSPGENDYSTVYHRASEKGALEVFRTLISDIPADKMTETINLQNINGETALHIATKKINPEIIKIIILNAKANPNLRDDDGNTPLHYLANKILCIDYLKKRLSESLSLIINHPDVDLSPLNFRGETPLKVAANLINDNKHQMIGFSKEFFETLISRGSNTDDLPANFYKTFTDTIEEATGNTDTNSSPKVLEAKVFNWIAGKKIKEIQTLWQGPFRMKPKTKIEIKKLINGRIGSKSILTKVVSDCDEDDVRFLLNKLDADPFVKDVDGEIPLNASLSQKNSAIADILVTKMKEKQNGSLDLDVVRSSSDMVKSYLIAKGAYIGKEDGTIKDFITADVLEMSFNNSVNSYDGFIRLAEKVSKNPDSQDHVAILNYDFLFPKTEKYDEESLMKATFLLLSMANKSEVKEAFKHPLMEVFVLLCFSMSRKLYIWDLVPYLIINVLITLSAIIGMNIIYDTIPIMIFLLIPMITRECFAVVTQGREYLNTFDNWIKWFTLFAIISLIYYLISDAMDEDLQIRKGFSHHLGWIMLGSSYVIFSLLGKSYSFARYVAIVKKITWNYFKALLPLSSIYLAFNYCFMIIFAPIDPNFTPLEEEQNNVTGIHNYFLFFETIPKTMVMSSGEFEYSSYSKESEEEPWYVKLSANLILVIFVFFIFMVLTNVFTVIAVGDVEVLKQNQTQSLLTSMLNDIYFKEAFVNIFSYRLQRLLPFNEPIDVRKVFIRINKLSERDGFIYIEKKKDFVSLRYLIEVKTRAALRAIYRKRIGVSREISAYPLPNDCKDGTVELMMSKMEQLERKLESQQKEAQEKLQIQLNENQEKLEFKLKELESKMKENHEKLEFQLKKLIENLQKR